MQPKYYEPDFDNIITWPFSGRAGRKRDLEVMLMFGCLSRWLNEIPVTEGKMLLVCFKQVESRKTCDFISPL